MKAGLSRLALVIVWLAMTVAVAEPSLLSGIQKNSFDTSVRPQDDFYRYVNGRWLDQNPIPEYLSNWGRWTQLQLNTYMQCRDILEALAASPGLSDPNRRRLADFYASYMNERAVDAAGLRPLQKELGRIQAMRNAQDVSALLAARAVQGLGSAIDLDIHADGKDADHNVVDLSQSALSLPDRDYYLSADAKFTQTRADYRQHVQRVLTLAGDANAVGDAEIILALETKLAEIQWTRVANRDPVATYNRFEVDALGRLAPGIDWPAFLREAGLNGRVTRVLVSQPSYFTALGRLVTDIPVAQWRTYLEFRLIDQLSNYLPTQFADERNAFYGAKLGGTTARRPRWLRATLFVDDTLGDALGREYVARHFPPRSQARAHALLDNLVKVFHTRIDALDWMSPDTRREAHAKLSGLVTIFGFPPRWKDYSGLRTSRTDLVGNLLAYRAFDYQRQVRQLSEPVDRNEVSMTAQQVNGYYSAFRNQVVLAAALMQPPFFQADADDAANYGGVGWFIAHELSHAFDDRGSGYDAKGNVREWMTQDDRARFAARTHVLVDQYSQYEAVPGVHLNGAMTLGENIADVSGLAIAYAAYHASLNGKPAPVIDGLTGDQRLFIGFAQAWASKSRPEDAVAHAKSDNHSPPQYRVQGALINQDAFYSAFDVRPGDKMYLPPERRVKIW